jgi:hypothetical protein
LIAVGRFEQPEILRGEQAPLRLLLLGARRLRGEVA